MRFLVALSLLVPALSTAEPLTDATNEPAVMPRDRDSASYRPVAGPLFTTRGPSAEDVVQHGAGDCYFMAALSELARMYPEVVRQMIREERDGTFTVTLYDGPVRGPAPQTPPVPVLVRVDRRLPARDGKLIYSNRATTAALWPELVEKAWAKLHGGYEEIGHGGNAANAFRGLAGWHYTELHVDALSADQLRARIADAIARGDSVVASTRGEDDVRPFGLLGNHAYSVLSTRRTSLTIRNPLGGGEQDFGIDELVRTFAVVGIAGPLHARRD